MTCYIANGQLFLWQDGQPVEYQSEFFAEKIADIERDNHFRSHAIGTDSEPGNPFSVWGGRARSVERLAITYRQVRARGNEIFFLVTFGQSVGLFRYHLVEHYEERLFHKKDLHIHSFDVQSDGEAFVFAIDNADGSADLYLGDQYGRLTEQLTSGDSLDHFPRFIDDDQRILFATSGIGRGQDEAMIDRTPTQIARLERSTKDLTVLFSLPGRDLIAACPAEGDDLVAVSAPYRSLARPGAWQQLRAVLLFPWYLILAVIGFLQGFIRLFGNRDITLTGPNIRQAGRRPVVLFSQEVAKATARDGTVAIPTHLQLRRPASDQIIASGVSALGHHEGRIAWASGNTIHQEGRCLLTAPRDHVITDFALSPATDQPPSSR